jgi:hypothetical protein
MTSEDMIAISQVHLEADPNRGNMVVLREREEAERFFMMFVGDAEFTAIAKEKGLVEPKRPLTHELYLGILATVPLELVRIEIYEMHQETFYARVIVKTDDNEQAIDSRPSDAVALALNKKIPILVNKDLFRRKLSRDELKEYEGLVKKVKF